MHPNECEHPVEYRWNYKAGVSLCKKCGMGFNHAYEKGQTRLD